MADSESVRTGRRIIRLPTVLDKIGGGKDIVYNGERAGTFPARIRISERCSGWYEDEIDQWIETRPRAVQREAVAVTEVTVAPSVRPEPVQPKSAKTPTRIADARRRKLRGR